jgi:hypothetical protein
MVASNTSKKPSVIQTQDASEKQRPQFTRPQNREKVVFKTQKQQAANSDKTPSNYMRKKPSPNGLAA